MLPKVLSARLEQYFAHGIVPIPIRYKEKEPAIRWSKFQKVALSKEVRQQVLEAFAREHQRRKEAENRAQGSKQRREDQDACYVNIGLVCGSPLVVLDVDDPEKFAKWCAKHGHLVPLCTTVCTPSGGMHYYFRAPEGVTIRRVDRLADTGAELRGFGHYVVAPDSQLERDDGTLVPYTFAPGRDLVACGLVEPPQWVLDEFVNFGRHERSNNRTHERSNKPTNGVGDWVDRLVEAVLPHWTEGVRHMIALGLSGLFCKRGVPEEVARSVVERLAQLAGDQETHDRVLTVFTSYNTARSVAGVTILQQVLDEKTLHTVLDLVPTPQQTHVSTPLSLQLLELDEAQYSEQHLCRLLVKEMAGKFAYASHSGWHSYDGRRWKSVEQTEVVRAVDEALYAVKEDLVRYCDRNDPKGKRLLAFLDRVSKPVNIERLVRISLAALMSAEPFQPITDPTRLAVGNGVVDLETLELIPYSPKLHVTAITEVPYNPHATAPLWLKFLHDITGGDQQLIDYLQLALGYSIAGAGEQERLFICYGTGTNGKTTFLRTIRNVLQEHAGVANPTSLTSDGLAESIARPDLLDIVTKRFVMTSELSEGGRFVENLVKTVTGRTPISVRRLYSNAIITVVPTCAIWLDTNYLPAITGSDHGIWRRLEIIPFNYRIVTPDPQMDKKLLAEAEGILRWLVEGAHRYLQVRQLPRPRVIQQAITAHRLQTDSVMAFVQERVKRGAGARTRRDAMYSAYVDWCNQNAFEPVGRSAFNRKMRTLGHHEVKVGGMWYWDCLDLS